MADTINYIGLTGVKSSVTVTLGTDTFDTLITAIAGDEGLPTDYYSVSLATDPNKIDTVYGDSSTPLNDASIGMADGDLVYCYLRQADTKEQRQIQKLEIAQVKRQAGGDTTKDYYRTLNTYDATRIPNPYEDNDINPDDDENTGALQTGRPWT